MLISPSYFKQILGRPVSVGDFAQLACLVSSLAAIGGALGSVVESDLAVRSATYRFREDDDERA